MAISTFSLCLAYKKLQIQDKCKAIVFIVCTSYTHVPFDNWKDEDVLYQGVPASTEWCTTHRQENIWFPWVM